jgi:hypothetical protein
MRISFAGDEVAKFAAIRQAGEGALALIIGHGPGTLLNGVAVDSQIRVPDRLRDEQV